MLEQKIRVVELFAGVGGFRLGLIRASDSFHVVWSNQYEPKTKKQDASEVYVNRFGVNNHSNQDIATVPSRDIPDHDLLVGGFPCQDYSIANRKRKGIAGAKGSLWWEIHRILRDKRPKMFLLENVDGLLSSPSKQKGRDLALILASLSDIGYRVEWQVINAADYGMPQRRKRVFLFGYPATTPQAEVLPKAFPRGVKGKSSRIVLIGAYHELLSRFNIGGQPTRPFRAYGTMHNRTCVSWDTVPLYGGGYATLGDVLLPESEVPKEYYVSAKKLPLWVEKKQGKKKRVFDFVRETVRMVYSVGSVPFPDVLTRPSRTILTKEGGAYASREKHIVEPVPGMFRRLVPRELERLNMFPDDFTLGVSDSKRAFLMGNALVVGVVERIGRAIAEMFPLL